MCLAKVYLNNRGETPILEDITHMQLNDNNIELETLLSETRIIPGELVAVDFVASKIFLKLKNSDKNYMTVCGKIK